MSLNKRLHFLSETMKRNAGAGIEQMCEDVIANQRRFAMEDGTIVSCPKTVPERPLLDANGRATTHGRLAGSRRCVVLCFRGSWCPFSTTSMRAYEAIRRPLADNGIAMYGVTPQHCCTLGAAVARNGLGFPLLTDPDQSFLEGLGVRVEILPAMVDVYLRWGLDFSKLNEAGDWSLPLEATFIVGADGAVQRAVAFPMPYDRMEPRAVIEHFCGAAV